MELRGRLVEMVRGRPVGLPDITVSIAGASYDVTNANGEFRLVIEASQPTVRLQVEDQSFKLLSPYEGVVPIPPDGKLQVAVCGAQNRRLREQVESLNALVRRREKESRLTQRQLQAMQQQLLDTVLHYEALLGERDAELAGLEQTSREQDRQIVMLQQRTDSLLLVLAAALEQQYLRQRAVYDQVSADLHNYLNHAYNLRDALQPVQISAYLINPAAMRSCEAVVQQYNAARTAILENHAGQIEGIERYWKNERLAAEARQLFTHLLEEVHERTIYPAKFSVFGPISEFHGQHMGRIKADRLARQAAEDCIRQLDPRLSDLKIRSDQLVARLGQTL